MGNSRLLLDEPSEGLVPVIVERMAAIDAIKAGGLSILLAEQNLHFSKLVADCAVVIETGQVRWSGSMAALDTAEDVRERYLSL